MSAETAPSAAPQAPIFDIALEVAYAEQLRVPGSGYLLREVEVYYSLTASVAAGTMVEPVVTGTSKWAIRCYEDRFTPGLEPTAEFLGSHALLVQPDSSTIRRIAALDPEVDWTSRPALAVARVGEEVWVAHRLPSSIGLDRTVACDSSEQYGAITLARGDAAMRAPGWVVTDQGEMTRAEALNGAADRPVYLVGDAGSGWIVHTMPATAAAPAEVSFTWDPGPEPEGGQAISITGTVRRRP
jgi:hypothetical protein